MEQDPCAHALNQMCLTYLEQASDMVDGFSAGVQATLPEALNFDEFSKLVANTCLSPSQLRMRLTKTSGPKTGKALVTSQVSTVMLSYLSSKELLTTCQFVCRKWYDKFVAVLVPKVALPGDLTNRVFRIKMKGAKAS